MSRCVRATGESLELNPVWSTDKSESETIECFTANHLHTSSMSQLFWVKSKRGVNLLLFEASAGIIWDRIFSLVFYVFSIRTVKTTNAPCFIASDFHPAALHWLHKGRSHSSVLKESPIYMSTELSLAFIYQVMCVIGKIFWTIEQSFCKTENNRF